MFAISHSEEIFPSFPELFTISFHDFLYPPQFDLIEAIRICQRDNRLEPKLRFSIRCYHMYVRPTLLS